MTIEHLQSKLDKLQNEFDEFVKNSKKEKWHFNEKQKAFLKTLDKKWKYIVRDVDEYCVYFYSDCPIKGNYIWEGKEYECLGDGLFKDFNFDNIKWTDEEPCEFRKYLGDSDD